MPRTSPARASRFRRGALYAIAAAVVLLFLALAVVIAQVVQLQALTRPASLETVRPASSLPAPSPVDGVDRGVAQRIIDGDTLVVRRTTGEDVKVRLVGIDAPERRSNPTDCYSVEATNALHAEAEGQMLVLTRDPETDDMDRYDRLLRVITVEGADSSINEALVAQGAARAYRSYPAALLPRLEALEAEARDAKRGLWGACPDAVPS